MTPIYVKDKSEVVLYGEYDSEKAEEILNQYNNWQVENELNSSIVNGTIKIKF